MKDTAEKSAAAQVNLVIFHPCAYVVAATCHLPIDLSVRSPQCEQSTCGPHLFQCQSGSQCVSNTQVLKYQTPRYFLKFVTLLNLLNQVCNGASNCKDASDERLNIN